MPDAFEFREIGVFKCDAEYKHDIPRQGVFNQNRVGKIILNKGENFEQGLRGLEGFERIWIIFVLNRNSSWKPIVSPPVQTATQKRIGVFASRAPYRPNMIGLSCVKLLSVEGNVITVDESDILNDTPILDIKPYIPKADAFPEAAAGWVDEQVISKFKLIKSDLFEKQNQFLQGLNSDLFNIAKVQLEENPFNIERKRIKFNEDQTSGVLSYRMFRIAFSIENQTITLKQIYSGYSKDELNTLEDKYNDKDIHRQFTQNFN
jgi:tRNA-Thr(GGU) m(6)t(6)A37 methyltransferase TsaA